MDKLFKGSYSLQKLSDYDIITLQSLHTSLWEDYLNKIRYHEKQIICDSMETFRRIAFLGTDYDNPKITLETFDKIKIHPKWKHGDNAPISRMSLQATMDLLEGFEWFVFSDMTSDFPRDKVFIKQVVELFQHIERRVHFLIRDDNLTTNVLNDPEYVTIENTVEYVNPDSESKVINSGYDSDMEKRKKLQKAVEEETFKCERPSLNYSALFDMDTMTTTFHIHFFRYFTWPPPMRLPKRDISKFRKWIFDQITNMNHEMNVTRARRFWYEEWVITESHYRIFQRRSPLSTVPTPREVMLSKNDELCEENGNFSIRSITNNIASQHQIRINTDAMLFFLGEQHGKICSEMYRRKIKDDEVAGVIYRERLLGTWTIFFSKHERYNVPSFTEAFVHLRVLMKQKGLPGERAGVFLNKFDNYF